MRALCVMEAHIFDHGFVVEEKQWQDMLAGMLFIVQVCVNKERDGMCTAHRVCIQQHATAHVDPSNIGLLTATCPLAREA